MFKRNIKVLKEPSVIFPYNQPVTSLNSGTVSGIKQVLPWCPSFLLNRMIQTRTEGGAILRGTWGRWSSTFKYTHSAGGSTTVLTNNKKKYILNTHFEI